VEQIAEATMQAWELSDFVAALAEAERLIASSSAAVQRAKSRCHEEIYEHVDVISKRLWELRVHTEWLRLVALGDIVPPAAPPLKSRQLPDRRLSFDRRMASMRKQLLARPAKFKKSA
jgi:hypothetical protein